MATKIARVLHKIFGNSGASTNFGKFGSETAGSGVKTKDIATIQALSAWDNGWQDAIIASNKAPFLEDMNSAFYEHSYHLAYLMQEGIPEWDTSTYYFIGSIVKNPGTTEIYASLINSNLGNALPPSVSDSNWYFLGDLRRVDTGKALARMWLGSAIVLGSGAIGVIQLDNTEFDVGSNVTLPYFKAPVTGYYQVNAAVNYRDGVAGKRYMAIIYNVTGPTVLATGIVQASNITNITPTVSDIVILQKDDHLRLAAYQDSGANANIGYLSKDLTFLSAVLLREIYS